MQFAPERIFRRPLGHRKLSEHRSLVCFAHICIEIVFAPFKICGIYITVLIGTGRNPFQVSSVWISSGRSCSNELRSCFDLFTPYSHFFYCINGQLVIRIHHEEEPSACFCDAKVYSAGFPSVGNLIATNYKSVFAFFPPRDQLARLITGAIIDNEPFEILAGLLTK